MNRVGCSCPEGKDVEGWRKGKIWNEGKEVEGWRKGKITNEGLKSEHGRVRRVRRMSSRHELGFFPRGWETFHSPTFSKFGKNSGLLVDSLQRIQQGRLRWYTIAPGERRHVFEIFLRSGQGENLRCV